jgi:hypothetical protein
MKYVPGTELVIELDDGLLQFSSGFLMKVQ